MKTYILLIQHRGFVARVYLKNISVLKVNISGTIMGSCSQVDGTWNGGTANMEKMINE